MTSDYQRGRTALGQRLRELRIQAGLSGKQLAAQLGWPASKVSKLEHGRQAPTVDDLRALTDAVAPEAVTELVARLRALETHYASWRRQLAAGTRARQEAWQLTESSAQLVRNFESACIPGLLQTPDYARWMFERTTSLHRSPQDIEEGVRARIQRQQLLYEPGRSFHFLVWEAALRVLICPSAVMAAQLDRLAGVVGLDTVRLGIVPLGVPLPVVPSHGFWIYDDALVMVETIGAELRLVGVAEIDPYVTVWTALEAAAEYGAGAHRVLARSRAALVL
ncbi:helix-turn-helix domain-containing protein [Streptacidiphilus melanogenes]|uniref:helix-turn-helix domain-containing protein n=1 Tax=Streptacidiphilus melanogenes TaxID=411235 RepID=UPI0005A903D7|nr:helix-turn-helix transcriptional regulator [Streptacidiphilus melanogenes]